jgi:nuclear transport factor 2 (NTF2) superfamily protein
MTGSPNPNLPPPFTKETAILKVRRAEDGWRSHLPARSIAVGVILLNSSLGGRKSSGSSRANGRASWSIA